MAPQRHPLLIFPCNGNGREIVSLIDAINAHQPTFEIVGFVDDTPSRQGEHVLGYPIVGGRDVLDRYPAAQVVAQPGSSASFRQRPGLIQALGLPLQRFAPALVHPQATVGRACQLGRNVVVYAGARLTTQVTLGDHVLILSNSVVGHDAVIEPYSVIASQVTVAGSVQVGWGAYIASGALLMPGIAVGAQALVGMGSVVLDTVPSGATVFANPARILPQAADFMCHSPPPPSGATHPSSSQATQRE